MVIDTTAFILREKPHLARRLRAGLAWALLVLSVAVFSADRAGAQDADLILSNDQVVELSLQKYKLRRLDPQEQCERFLEKAHEIIGNNENEAISLDDKRKMLDQLRQALETRHTSGSLISYVNTCVEQLGGRSSQVAPETGVTNEPSAALNDAKLTIDLHEKQIEELERRLDEAEQLNSQLQHELSKAEKDNNDALQRKEIQYEKRVDELEDKLSNQKIELDSILSGKMELEQKVRNLTESVRDISDTSEKCNGERNAMQQERDKCQEDLRSLQEEKEEKDKQSQSSSCPQRCRNNDDDDDSPVYYYRPPCRMRPCRRYYY